VLLLKQEQCALADSNSIFDTAYWNAQSPAVASLQAIAAEGQRETAAQALALQGLIIDVPIMVWGWDPWKVMLLRQAYGYTWVPSMLQPNLAAAPGGMPGFGQSPYDPDHPPAGSIEVSANLADYPPYAPPIPPPPPPAALPADSFLTPGGYIAAIGSTGGGGIYAVLAGDNVPDGEIVTAPDGHQYMRHQKPLPFGMCNWYAILS
jgi:hypothetical protein